MNKNDVILSVIIILFALSIFLYFIFSEKTDLKIANVYYQNEKILSIRLDQNENNTYTVKGYNGDVTIVTHNGKIKVESENSPLHLCSKQGFINKSYESIICLPNKIVIKIDDSSDIDAIVG